MPERLTTALSRSPRLERELGQAGMAAVYLAEDVKHRHLIETSGETRFQR
jgi:hypothetical protein